MRPVILKVGPLAAANAAIVAASQSRGSAGALTLTATPVVLDTARRVIITSAGNDSAVIFAITGTNASGNAIGETVSGANAGVASSVLDYLTVTSVTTSAATASTVTVGTNGVAASPWFRTDDYGNASFAIQANVFGAATGTIQSSLDDPNSIYAPVMPQAMTWINHPDPSANGFTASFAANYNQNPGWMRILLTAGTGSITTTIIQGGSPPA